MNEDQEEEIEALKAIYDEDFTGRYEGHPISSDNEPIKQNLFL